MKNLIKMAAAELMGVILILTFSAVVCVGALLAIWAASYKDQYGMGFFDFLKVMVS